MKVYLVGGAVRDELLGLKPRDLDYVVIGSSVAEMLAEGYTQVGNEFPVFLHPVTRDEYALARTERKVSNGYHGFRCVFTPDVTLREDLERRDLTINSMAKDLVTGEIIDPFHGRRDLHDGILRPTSIAFRDDPVRLLRAGRFLARYPSFDASVALHEEALALYESGELDHLTPARVWKELKGALSEAVPSKFFWFLKNSNLFPEVNALEVVEQSAKWHPEGNAFRHTMRAIDYAAHHNYAPEVVFGALCHDFGKAVTFAEHGNLFGHEAAGVPIVKSLCERLPVPNKYSELAEKSTEFHTLVHTAFELKPRTVYKLLQNFKQLVPFRMMLQIADADKHGRGAPFDSQMYLQPAYLIECWEAMRGIDTSDITSSMPPGRKVGEAIRNAQIRSISEVDKTQYIKED